MTIRHHIGDEILLQYAAGSLAEGWSLLVATHLALCPLCRSRNRTLEAVGGSLLESLEAAPLRPDALETLMQRIRHEEPPPPPRTKVATVAGVMDSVVPEPLQRYLGGDFAALKWRRLGPFVEHFPLRMGDDTTRARLLRVPPSATVPPHGHRGREMTLILAGALHDDDKVFTRGDVEEMDETLWHQPLSGPQEACVCLAVTDAPLRFSSWAARLAQPFLGI